VRGNWSHVVSTGSVSAMALTLPRTFTPSRSCFVASFTLYGATKIVAWATWSPLTAQRVSAGGRRRMCKVPNWNLKARPAHQAPAVPENGPIPLAKGNLAVNLPIWKTKAARWLPAQGCIKLPDREPSRLAAGDNGLGCWTFWRLFALVAAASRDGSRSEAELDPDLSPAQPGRVARR
jgi:hypothetical protein